MIGYKVCTQDWIDVELIKNNLYKLEDLKKIYDIDNYDKISGFRFYDTPIACFDSYHINSDSIIAVIKALGHITKKDELYVTDKFKVVYFLSFEEFINRVHGCLNSLGTFKSDGVSESMGVYNSEIVKHGSGIFSSKEIRSASGVSSSSNLGGGIGISDSTAINNCSGISYSDGIVKSKGVYRGAYVFESKGINYSQGVQECKGVSESWGIVHGHGLNCVENSTYTSGSYHSYGLHNCHGVSREIFNTNKKYPCRIFNKEVSEERFREVYRKIETISKYWYIKPNNLEQICKEDNKCFQNSQPPKIVPTVDDIFFSSPEQRYELWKDIPKELLDYIVSLPEFDSDIFYEVTGIKVEENNNV